VSNLRSPGVDVKQAFPADPLRNLHLLTQLVHRDFRARFTGSALGLAWAVLQPLSLVTLYWFVFTVMIPRPPGGEGSYVLYLISGLLPWLGISEGLMRSTPSIVENAAMVRRLPFRSELLVVVPNVSAILFELIAMVLFCVALAVEGKTLRGLWILPLALVAQLALQVGASWILAVIHVFFRDVMQLLGFVLSFLFYLSPILYSPPARFTDLFVWNAMTPLLGLFRSALLGSSLPSVSSIVFLLTVCSAVFGGGLMFFRRAQPGLADLI
jgi:lipopolysaccharide transport system permease protein